MRSFLFIFFIAVQVPFVFSTDGVISFPRLADNERFAYSIQNMQDDQGRHWQRMTMFAVRDNDINDVSELFSWGPVRWWDVQFTNDFKIGFFVESNRTEGGGFLQHLYMANGFNGQVKRVLTDVGHGALRISMDGRFVSYLRSALPAQYVHIFLFDVENEIMSEFKWKPNRPYPAERFPIGGWRIIRIDDMFRIIAIIEWNYVVAVADIDPSTMELVTVWEDPELVGFSYSSLPLLGAPGLFDDVSTQFNNPNIRLQR